MTWRISPDRIRASRTGYLRRLARYLGVRHWSRLRRVELVEEILWYLDPWG